MSLYIYKILNNIYNNTKITQMRREFLIFKGAVCRIDIDPAEDYEEITSLSLPSAFQTTT